MLPLTDLDTSSGAKPVDTGDNGGIWDDIFGNAGSILLGGAGLINALKGNTPQTVVYAPPPTNQNQMNMGGMWLYIIIALIAIVLLFIIFKK